MGHTVPAAVPHSFADDLSVVTSAPDEATVVRTLQQVHTQSLAFVTASGGAFCPRKSHTFGDSFVAGRFPGLGSHSLDLRLVGGSVVAAEASLEPSALDESRRSKWCSTLARIRLLPVSWQRRCGTILPSLGRSGGTARTLATVLSFACSSHRCFDLPVAEGTLACLRRSGAYHSRFACH